MVFEKRIKQLLQDTRMSANQRKTIEAFTNYQKQERLESRTRYCYATDLRQLAFYLGKQTAFKDATKEQLINYFMEKREEKQKAEKLAQRIRRFYKWLLDPEDQEYPDVVKGPVWKPKHNNYKTGGRRPEDLKPEDILKPKEIEALLEVANNNQKWKTLYAILLDSGGRIDREILPLTIGDITIEKNKTQYKVKLGPEKRLVICIESYDEMVKWINLHPRRWDRKAPLFPGDRDATKSVPYPTVYGHLNRDVREAAKQCPSLKHKRVYPHLFRHTKATWLVAQKVPAITIKHQMGWDSTAMIERYAHLATEDIERHIQDAHGKTTDTDKKPTKLIPYDRVPTSWLEELKKLAEKGASAEDLRAQIKELGDTIARMRIDQIAPKVTERVLQANIDDVEQRLDKKLTKVMELVEQHLVKKGETEEQY